MRGLLRFGASSFFCYALSVTGEKVCRGGTSNHKKGLFWFFRRGDVSRCIGANCCLVVYAGTLRGGTPSKHSFCDERKVRFHVLML
ncbi:hypothetical protein KP509_08G038500 [Ceratopteris richardii]|uniref:Secreted protein n=1 Tax=Ceratopteris richardii TaxID=49495 RepID=A0A8T2UD79_CERRI|nr:hypothetical protein KP509_08G038500 [Ceratopteris richardii]